MRLNIDCVRDILLCIEDLVTPTKVASFIDIDLSHKIAIALEEAPRQPTSYQKLLLKKYSNEELIYHLKYSIKADLIEPYDSNSQEEIIIENLTPKGHEFIENIRYDSVFEKTKSICKELGVKSLSSVVQISENVISEIIKSHIISS